MCVDKRKRGWVRMRVRRIVRVSVVESKSKNESNNKRARAGVRARVRMGIKIIEIAKGEENKIPKQIDKERQPIDKPHLKSPHDSKKKKAKREKKRKMKGKERGI